MTILEDIFQKTGNATNRTLPSQRFVAEVAAEVAKVVTVVFCARTGSFRRADMVWRRDVRRCADRQRFRRFLQLLYRTCFIYGHSPGESVRFQFHGAGKKDKKKMRASARPALPINVANVSRTLSLDMTAEEAAATPFYANVTR